MELIYSVLVLPVAMSGLVYLVLRRKRNFFFHVALSILCYLALINSITYFKYGFLLNALRVFTFKFWISAVVASLFGTLLSDAIVRYLKLRSETVRIPRLYLFVSLSFSVVIFTYVHWLTRSSGTFNFEILLFNLKVPLNTTNANFIKDMTRILILPVVVIMSFRTVLWHRELLLPLDGNARKTISFSRKLFFYSVPFIVMITSVFFAVKGLDLVNLVRYFSVEESFIEENYVEASDQILKFPHQKRNLIVIFMESYETTFFNKENGGARDYNLLNRSVDYLQNGAVNFSHQEDTYGGMETMPGASWSIAGMTAQLSGVPYKVPTEIENQASFLPGIISIGDILENQGYRNVFMVGSDASEFGIKDFYQQHGNHEIIDYNSLIDSGKLEKDYYEWWGFEDKKLYELAQDKLNELQKSPEPFNLVLETNDTHFPDGYTDASCTSEYDKPYANSVSCTDKMLGDFLDWAQSQPFFENTTIVVVGDHLSMETAYYEGINDYHRTVYNMIINPHASVGTEFNRFNRLFSAADMYPTILRSLGVSIHNHRLGLGTDLFSNEETLYEKFGVSYVQDALSKHSKFYNETFIYGRKGQ